MVVNRRLNISCGLFKKINFLESLLRRTERLELSFGDSPFYHHLENALGWDDVHIDCDKGIIRI